MTCDAHLRPFTSSVEVACEETGEHERHAGTVRDYAYPGSQTIVEWFEADRRTYHGDWPGPCGDAGCSLPAGHAGRHVT